MIPTNFDEWYACITRQCKIDLNSQFAKERLSILTDEKQSETIKFKQLYGTAHLENIINWYKKI